MNQQTRQPTLEPLCVETIKSGQALKQTNEAIERMARHVVEKPTIDKKRVITLTIEIKPIRDKETGINTPEVAYKIDTKYPSLDGAAIYAQVDGRGVVVPTYGPPPIQTDFEMNRDSSAE